MNSEQQEITRENDCIDDNGQWRGPTPYIPEGDKEKIYQKQKESQEFIETEEEIEQNIEYQNMEKIDIPAYEKKLGAESFKKQEYQQAIKHYSKSLMSFNYLVKSGIEITEEQMINFIETIQVPGNLNISLCYLKEKQYQLAEQYASIALDIDENNIKGLYRRAISRIHLGEFSQARIDLKKAYQLEPNNKEIILGFELLQKKQQSSKQKMTKTYKKIIGGMDYSKDLQNNQQDNDNNNTKWTDNFNPINLKDNFIRKLKNTFYSIEYNCRITLLTPLNFVTDKFCKRKIPSQFYKKIQ